MKLLLPSPSDCNEPLMNLLEEWQAEPEVSPNFDRALRQRLQAADAAAARHPWLAGLRSAWQASALWRVYLWPLPTAAAMLLLAVGAFFYFGTGRPVPVVPPAPVAQTAQLDPMVRDLQTLARDGDLLEHLDFLSVPVVEAAPREQE